MGVKDRLKIFAGILIGVFILTVGLTGDKETVRPDKALLKPSLDYPLGTDHLGRDIFSRLCFAITLSVFTSIISWFAVISLGLIAGGIAALSYGLVSMFILTLIKLIFVTPFILILISLSSILGTGILPTYLILVLFLWAVPARQTYLLMLDLKKSKFMIAVRSFGFSNYQVILMAMLPMVIRSVVAGSLPLLPDIIALDAGLSMLGLGASPPTPTLGNMLFEGLKFAQVAWHQVLFPVVALSLLVYIAKKIAEKIR